MGIGLTWVLGGCTKRGRIVGPQEMVEPPSSESSDHVQAEFHAAVYLGESGQCKPGET